jgi:nicotinamide mononucleotide (NMN) deamidase PncC
MPMTAASLTSKLIAELGAATDGAMQSDVLGKIAKAIVDEIQQNATVSVSVPATGLVAPNGPVTGAATGTGTIS